MSSISEKVRKVFAGSIAEGWDTKGNLIHKMNGKDNRVYEKIREFGYNGMTLLDVGCATGRLLEKADSMFKNSSLKGIDFSADMISYAKQKNFSNDNAIQFICDDWLEYDFKDEIFDLIIFKFVLHHLQDNEMALKKAKSLLKPGGKLIIYTPGEKYLVEIFGKVKDAEDCLGRKRKDQIINLLQKIEINNISIESCEFQISMKSFSDFVEFLKRIGSYQRIMHYSNNNWNNQFMLSIQNKYIDGMWHTGEYFLIIYKNIIQE